MSNDTEQREIYDMRAKILKDRVSALNKAKEEGREQAAIEALKLGLDIEVVAKISKLSIEKVRKLADR